ncbi:hypothetical protein Tdes44962_MAKER01318 [Teratosphaeria destructans]|uniref:Uncharacterized protein n=1 Tax=Teratosphaeria destructans TaxID=418781 RepID=A0A9W7T154_9PEZI|nr:hypothetical protein Tdes44962_MAKER01318 [Teratosphaeria destructans]
MGGWNASSETWGSSDSFSTERTYYVEDYGFAGGEGQSSTCQPPRTGAVNARGLLVKSPDSCGPVALPASHSLGQPTGVVEDESYQAHVEHPVRVPDVTTTDYYGVQEQESSKTSRTAAESQRTAVAQDQASMDRLVVENQSLRLMLATALKTGASTKTTDVRGGGPTTVTDDATSTLDSMRRHLQALANLVEAERDIRIHLMSIYDQELNRARGNLAAAGFCIEDTRYVLEGFAAKMSQFGRGAAFERTAPGSGDTMVLINEEKAKRNALSSLIDERLKGLAERVGRPSAGSDALHQSFARDVDKLNGVVKMQRQGCARRFVDLSQDMDLLAASAGSREAHLQSWG